MNKKKNKKEWKPIIGNFKYDKIIAKYAKKYGVAPDLIKSVVCVESSFKPSSISSKNCKGLMQLSKAAVITVWGKKKAEAKWRKILDPEINIETGTRYLKKWLNYYDNNIHKAVADYNMGHRNFGRWMAAHKNNLEENRNDLPKETNDYINKLDYSFRGYKKEKSGAFGDCIWRTTILGIHICIKVAAPSSRN